MQRHVKYSFLLSSIAAFFFLNACDDIIQKDISAKIITINSPADSFISEKYDITFWWSELKEAKKYRLQIVSPSFKAVQTFVIDTLTSDTRFSMQLMPGKYQWRLRGENGSSYTAYIIRDLQVDTNSNLIGQSFYVSTPSDDFFTNDPVINFSWTPFPYASHYEYFLTATADGTIETRTTNQTILSDTLNEGIYSWKVRAVNSVNGTYTAYSSPRAIYVDMTPPIPSQPFSPSDNATDTNSVTLRWHRPTDGYADSIWIASDSLFVSNLQKNYTTDTLWLLQPLNMSTTYFWKLKTRDRAGNWSVNSAISRFNISL